MPEIAQSWESLTDPQWWIRGSAGIFIAIVAFSGSLTLGLFGTGSVSALVLATIVSCIGYAFWRMGRWCYWKSGSGFRVAVSLEGVRVPPEELHRTKLLLIDAAKSGRIPRLISIRLVPTEFTLSEQRSRNAVSRYGFDAILAIGVERNEQSSKRDRIKFAIAVDNHKSADKALMESALLPLAGLISLHRSSQSQLDAASFRSESLFDILLFMLATTAVNDNDWDTAVDLLEELDNRLRPRQPDPKIQPRLAIRDMAVKCLLHPCIRSSSQWTDKDELRQRASRLKLRVPRYEEQFPFALISCARTLFLAGDVQGARTCCERLRQLAQTPYDRTIASLGLGAVCVLSGQYTEAAKHYAEFLESRTLADINWPDLIDFADTISEIYPVDAIFLRALYRKMTDGVAPIELELQVNNWFDADPSRNALRVLYRTRASVIKPKGEQKVVRKAEAYNRFKRRRKPKKQ